MIFNSVPEIFPCNVWVGWPKQASGHIGSNINTMTAKFQSSCWCCSIRRFNPLFLNNKEWFNFYSISMFKENFKNKWAQTAWLGSNPSGMKWIHSNTSNYVLGVRKETLHIARDWMTKSETSIQYVSCNFINCEVYVCSVMEKKVKSSNTKRRKND